MSKHLKRLAMPRSWPLPRKTNVWVVRPSPGPHPMDRSLPLLLILRDVLGLCKTRREGVRIITRREVLVDGAVVTNEKHPVGFMDVISIPKTKDFFRMMLDVNGRLRLVRITDREAGWKLARIEDKTTVKGRKIQLNLHDGRNILLEKDAYRTGDVLKMQVPEQKVVDVLQFKEGSVALLIGGKHVGTLGTIEKYKPVRNPKENLVDFKEGFSSVKKHVFIVGKETSEVTLP